jgi:hypothetical protein
MSILLFYIITITNDNNKELLNDAEINHSSVFMLQVYFENGKSLLHPQPMRVGTHHPQPMKMDFYPLNFLRQDKSPHEAVLKNHSKSQKNHRMENPIVLDSK